MEARRWALLGCLAGLLAAAAAGCGGGGEQTQTRTAPSPAERLETYFEAMRPRHARFQELAGDVVAAIARLRLERPDASWDRTEAALGTASRGLDELGVAISRVRAPAPLAEVHRGFAEAVLALGQYVYSVEQAVAARVATAVTTAAAADTRPIGDARAAWQAALLRAARAAGIPSPDWLAPKPSA